MNLFDDYKKNKIEDHWIDMPEFVQEKQEPYAKIIIRFENKKDLVEFSKIIDQKITKKTKSIWYPFKSHFRDFIMEWEDES